MFIEATTKIYGIFGHPVSHSLSPVMHNSAFSKLRLDCVYVAFDVCPQDISFAVKSIKSLNLSGINVTIPHKQAVIPYLNEISVEAKLVGAVNTIKNEGGHLKGFNTDVGGVIRAMKEKVGYSPCETTAFLVGAGGAARAVLCGLINSSSAGMEDNNLLNIPIELLPKHSVVYDLVYKPSVTKLVESARRLNYKAESGLSMLLYQGIEAFEIWTGVRAPVEVMRETLFKYQ